MWFTQYLVMMELISLRTPSITLACRYFTFCQRNLCQSGPAITLYVQLLIKVFVLFRHQLLLGCLAMSLTSFHWLSYPVAVLFSVCINVSPWTFPSRDQSQSTKGETLPDPHLMQGPLDKYVDTLWLAGAQVLLRGRLRLQRELQLLNSK